MAYFAGIAFTRRSSVTTNIGAGNARITNGGTTVEVQNTNGVWEAVVVTAAQYQTGIGVPSVAPGDPSKPSTYESSDLNLFWQWDTDQRLWRSTGQIKENLVLASLPADTYTRIPDASILTAIDDWLAYRSDGTPITSLSVRLAADGWPELHSLNAYTNIQISAFGRSEITP